MARPAQPERSRSALPLRQVSRFCYLINSDMVFGTRNSFNLDPIGVSPSFFGADLNLYATPGKPTRKQRGGSRKHSTGKTFVAAHRASDHHRECELAVMRTPRQRASQHQNCCSYRSQNNAEPLLPRFHRTPLHLQPVSLQIRSGLREPLFRLQERLLLGAARCRGLCSRRHTGQVTHVDLRVNLSLTNYLPSWLLHKSP